MSHWNPTTVDVLGSLVSFQGSNLENPDQRMQFVNQVSSTFMAKYAQPNGIAQTIHWLQNYNKQPNGSFNW